MEVLLLNFLFSFTVFVFGIGGRSIILVFTKVLLHANRKPPNLNSSGQWVTAYIELQANYNVSGIDISSVLLNGTVHAVSDPKYGFVTNESEYLTDLDHDGISERMFKFNREEVAGILKAGDKVTVTFTGKVEYNNGIYSGMASFEGSDVIKVTEKGINKDKTK